MQNFNPLESASTSIIKKLHSKKYFVRIPRIYIYTEKEKEVLGIPIDEINGVVNNKSVMDIVDSYKSIYDLAQITYEDNSIYVTNTNDVMEIHQIAGEALNTLQNSPGGDKYSELVFALEALVTKIEETYGTYLGELYKKKDNVEQYKEETFGQFDELNKLKARAPEVTEIKPKEIRKNIYGLNFRDISL